MAKKYYRGDLKLNIETKEIEIVMRPDCGFDYSAEHSTDNDKKEYECPLCEIEEMKEQNKRYREQLKLIRSDTFYKSGQELVSPFHVIRKRVDKALESESNE